MSSPSPGPPASPPAPSARAQSARAVRLRRRISLLLLIALVVAGAAWRYRITRPEYRFARGEHALRAGDTDGAWEYADRLEEAGYPDHAELLRAEALFRSKAADRALVHLSRVRADGPFRLRAASLTGRCLLALGALRQADEVLRGVVGEQPDDAEAHRGLAVIAYDLGQLGEAVERLRRIAELDPADARPHRTIGLIYKDMGQNPEAEEAYREALRRGLAPHVEQEVRVELAGVLVRQGKYAPGLEVLDAVPPDAADEIQKLAVAARAECLRGLARSKEAAPVLDAALPRQPTAALYRLRGQVYEDEARPADAIRCYERAVELDPADHQSHYLLGQAYAGAGRKDDAARELAKAEQLSKDLDLITALSKEAMAKPWDAAVRFRLAELSERLGKPQLAKMWRDAAAKCSVAPR